MDCLYIDALYLAMGTHRSDICITSSTVIITKSSIIYITIQHIYTVIYITIQHIYTVILFLMINACRFV